MTKHGILFVGFLIASTSLVALGCEETETSGGSSSSSSSGAGGASSSSSSSSASSSSSGTAGSGGAGAITAYCDAIMTNCATTNAQYPNMASCMAAAAAFPSGAAADTAGDTLGCRIYHAGAASGDAPTHCPHAGPSGDATCGTTCEGFCDFAVDTCPTEWKDRTACLAACALIKTNGMKYNTSFTSGDSIECRLYHLSVAATDAGSATMHCPHTLPVSSQCN